MAYSPKKHRLEATRVQFRRMAPWILPALKVILPHVKTIYDTAAPVFTKKKAEAVPDPTRLLQQQIAELQAASAQNSAHVKELAAQLQSTVAALQEAATLAEHRLRRVTIIAALAGAFSAAALLIALFAAVMR
jgi:DNA-directed RNA polymerase sigma subunit (sigma70/sigma32)